MKKLTLVVSALGSPDLGLYYIACYHNLNYFPEYDTLGATNINKSFISHQNLWVPFKDYILKCFKWQGIANMIKIGSKNKVV